MGWKVEFYSSKVIQEISKWSTNQEAKFNWILKNIERDGPFNIGMPHIKSLTKGLFEIRIKSNEGIARALFCIEKQKIILILSGFIKKTQKTPKNELELALKRMKEVVKNA